MTIPPGPENPSVVMITGAARGQGEAHARLLASRGVAVVLLDGPSVPIPSVQYPLGTAGQVREVASDIRATGGRAIAVEADVRSQADLDRAVEVGLREFGRIDGLVANAGIWGEIASVWQMSEANWQDTLDVNLSGCWRSIKAVAPVMIEQGEGSIVLISSVVGLGEGMAMSSNYAASKHGVIGLMMSAAQEFGPHCVRVNAVCPGFVDTDMNRWQGSLDLIAGRPGGSLDDLLQAGLHYSNLRGQGPMDPMDVAKAVAFLLSDDAARMTGAIVPVDAGHTILPRVNQNPVPSR